MHIIWTTYTT